MGLLYLGVRDTFNLMDDLLDLCLGKQDIFGKAIESLVVHIHIELLKVSVSFCQGHAGFVL